MPFVVPSSHDEHPPHPVANSLPTGIPNEFNEGHAGDFGFAQESDNNSRGVDKK
jgi:hypothetical protein